MTKNILIVQDDLVVAKLWQMLLQGKGIQVEAVADGKLAIEKLGQNPPDLVLLDLMLPQLNGVEVLKYIRSNPNTKTTPVLVLSNASQSHLTAAALEAGATKCLTKADCSLDQLLAEICAQVLPPPAPPAAAPAAVAPPRRPAAPPPAAARSPSYDAPTPAPHGETAQLPHEFRQSFLEGSAQTLMALRNQLVELRRSDQEASQVHSLTELMRSVHVLGDHAGLAGLVRIAQIASALELFLRELREEPSKINPASLRTLAQAVDFLAKLFPWEAQVAPGTFVSALIMAVDDEVISRWTVRSALELANLKAVALDDPNLALAVLEQNRFDLIILDVDMPTRNGYELCKDLRATPMNKTTPVIFVTSLSDFESRARSTLSGGNVFIAKPFLLIELAVKALILIYQGQMESHGNPGSSAT